MRKTPRQARSRATVERIIAAGRTVLVDHGYDAFSTNRVAAVAGLSPGSLYQYFPDKVAILDVVIERYWNDVAERVAASLADRISLGGALGPEAIRATADALLTALEADPALLRVLYEELPHVGNRQRRLDLERRVRELLAIYLAARGDVRVRSTPGLTAWVIVIAIENIALHWVLDSPDFDRDLVLDEIAALVGGYLA